jgi:hypothetical protein
MKAIIMGSAGTPYGHVDNKKYTFYKLIYRELLSMIYF